MCCGMPEIFCLVLFSRDATNEIVSTGPVGIYSWPAFIRNVVYSRYHIVGSYRSFEVVLTSFNSLIVPCPCLMRKYTIIWFHKHLLRDIIKKTSLWKWFNLSQNHTLFSEHGQKQFLWYFFVLDLNHATFTLSYQLKYNWRNPRRKSPFFRSRFDWSTYVWRNPFRPRL